MPGQEDWVILSPDAILMVVVLLGSALLAFILVIILNLINNPFWPIIWYALFGVILFSINLLIPEKHEETRERVESRRGDKKQSILPMIILLSAVISLLASAFLSSSHPLYAMGFIALGIFLIVLTAIYAIKDDS